MKNLLPELVRWDYDDNSKTINGISWNDNKALQQYERKLEGLYCSADFSLLVNEKYAEVVSKQMLSFISSIQQYATDDTDELRQNQELMLSNQKGGRWNLIPTIQKTSRIKEIAQLKISYAQKILSLISGETQHEVQSVNVMPEEEWINYEQLKERYHFKGASSVNDAAWRKKHNFYPAKQDGKGCALRISVSELTRWLQGEKK